MSGLMSYVRATDPEESRDAARRIRFKVTDLEMQVLAALVLRGPSTTAELAEYATLQLAAVSPRMAPLERRGFVTRIGRRDGTAIWDVMAIAVLATQ